MASSMGTGEPVPEVLSAVLPGVILSAMTWPWFNNCRLL